RRPGDRRQGDRETGDRRQETRRPGDRRQETGEKETRATNTARPKYAHGSERQETQDGALLSPVSNDSVSPSVLVSLSPQTTSYAASYHPGRGYSCRVAVAAPRSAGRASLQARRSPRPGPRRPTAWRRTRRCP